MDARNQVVPLDASAQRRTSSFNILIAIPPVAYSINKFLALDAYISTTPSWRVAGVLFVTPLPALVCALVPAFVPLQNPLDPRGARANPGYLVIAFLIALIAGVGALVTMRASSGLSPAVYSFRQILGVSSVSAIVQCMLGAFLFYVWRFPIPMSWVVLSTALGPGNALGHLLVFRDRCWRDTELIRAIQTYMPALSIQSIQLVLYPAFSVLFDNVSSMYQVLLTLGFPLIKYFMKRLLRKYTTKLKDCSSEVAVTGIEICASLYQSMILQNAPSQAALIIVMATDVLQGLVVVKLFMDRPSSVPRNQIVRDALAELKVSGKKRVNASQPQLSTALVVPEPMNLDPKHVKETKRHPSEKKLGHTSSRRIPVRRASTNKASPVVAEALHLVSVAESILLVEYLEVAIPLVNAVFIAVACQFDGAQYNTRLRHLYFHPNALVSAMRSIIFYSFLQLLSFVAMHLVMRCRYGMSATHHLAFVLERHWESIIGKMIAWLPVILHFTLIHFGVDFSFRFDFAAMLHDEKRP